MVRALGSYGGDLSRRGTGFYVCGRGGFREEGTGWLFGERRVDYGDGW